MMVRARLRTLISIGAVLCVSFAAVESAPNAGAADAMQFNSGNIIDDRVFTNSSSMSVAQIQQFLESKGAHCVAGQQPCLKDFRHQGKQASTVIYELAQEFQINPQVLIVTLQKEQGLVTATYPTNIMYRSATGYGCPDTAACDSQYYGFYNQVRWSAVMYRAIMNNSPTWYTPYSLGNNRVYYHPNLSGCGSSTVNIQNRATVALYSYTPYQPNTAALQAGYGTGDGCSAYGNRNFYLFFTDWFGSVRGSISTTGLEIPKDAAGQMFTGQKVDIKFTLRNQTSMSYTFDQVGVAIRGPQGQNLDPGWSGRITIAPGAAYTYSRSFTPTQEGEYRIYMSSLAEQDDGWRECHLDNSQSTCYNSHIIQHPIEILATPQVVRTATSQPIDELRQKQGYTISYTLRNTSQLYSAKPGSVMIAGRTSGGVNRDMVSKNPGSLVPNQHFTYTSSSLYSDTPGMRYTFYVSTSKDGGKTYEEQRFRSASSDVKQSLSVTMKAGIALTEGPSFEDDGVRGARVNVRFRIKNYTDQPVDLGRVGLVVRGPQGQNLDPGWNRIESLHPFENDGVYTYRAAFLPNATGNWSVAYMQVSSDMRVWNSAYPISETSSVMRSATLPVKEATTLLEGPKTTNTSPHVSQAVPVTFKIKTVSSQPVDLGRVGLVVRGPQGQNLDTGWQRVQDFSTNENDGIYTYQAVFYPNAVGRWTISYSHVTTDMRIWNTNYPASDSSGITRSMTIDVRPQATVTTGIQVSSNSLGVQQATFSITNHGITDVDLGKVGLAVRDPYGANRDAWWEDFQITAGQTKTHTVPVGFNHTGKWSFYITGVKNGVWSAPAAENSSIIRQLIVDVQ